MKKIALIGAGNVNWHLGHALPKKHYSICQVYSRTRASAQALAKSLDCSFTTKLAKVDTEADIVLIAVSDDAIAEVANKLVYLEDAKRLFIHTSGSTSLSILSNHFSKCGVFWPPQSLRKEDKIDIKQTPFVLVAEDENVLEIEKFANRISRKVTLLSEDQKSNLHLAAVFSNNFVNHLFSIAFDICQEKGLDFELLLPIIKETTAKIKNNNPSLLQTGPAIRADQKTLKNHLALLKKNKELKKIYSLLSESINPKLK